MTESAINERFKMLMDRKGLKQKQLAEMLGCTPSNVNDIVKARRGVTGDMLQELCVLFPDLDADWLLKGEGTMLTSDVKKPFESWTADLNLDPKSKMEIQSAIIQLSQRVTMFQADVQTALTTILGKSDSTENHRARRYGKVA